MLGRFIGDCLACDYLGLSYRHKRIHRLLIGADCLPCFLLSSYVDGRCLALAPQSGAKQIFYCTVYYITLNSDLSVICLLFKEENCV
jgi:hypothetical protein